MAEVSFIGLGAMGFALANTAARSGREIVVWNRSRDKALPLVDGNVTVASTPVEAISASPMIVVCVSDYETTQSILGTPECMAALESRTLIQLSSGSPGLARSARDWAKAAGISYLDGEIVAYVNQVGCDELRRASCFGSSDSLLAGVEPWIHTSRLQMVIEDSEGP